jgi:hypothetical protein
MIRLCISPNHSLLDLTTVTFTHIKSHGGGMIDAGNFLGESTKLILTPCIPHVQKKCYVQTRRLPRMDGLAIRGRVSNRYIKNVWHPRCAAW